MTAKELPTVMSLISRALSPIRLLGAAAVAAVLAVTVALVVWPSPPRHDLAVSEGVVAPDTIETHRPVASAASRSAQPSLPTPPVAVDDIAIDMPLGSPVVAAARGPHGTYLAGADGGVFALSHAAPFDGSMSGHGMNSPVVGIALDPAGPGYWLVGADGGVFAFDAPFLGPAGVPAPTHPVVGIAATPTGLGYWVAASDGGVFAYGDAKYLGGMSGQALTHPIVAITATPTGHGYWLVASDGGVFAYGDAAFFGSPTDEQLKAPVVAMVASPTGRGYLLASADGGVFSYGDAAWLGSPLDVGRGRVVGIVLEPDGYRLVTDTGALLAPGDKPVAPPPEEAPAAVSQSASTSPSRSQPRATAPAPAPAPAPTVQVPTGSAIVAAINAARQSNGLGALRADSRLGSLASSWSGWMSQNGVLQHQDLSALLSQSTWSSSYSALAENIYVTSGSPTAASIVAAWMASPGHRANILSTSLTSVGAGAQAGGGQVWATADFGTAR